MAQQKKTQHGKIGQYATVHLKLGAQLGRILSKVAKEEDRGLSSMVRVLIQEALKARGVKL